MQAFLQNRSGWSFKDNLSRRKERGSIYCREIIMEMKQKDLDLMLDMAMVEERQVDLPGKDLSGASLIAREFDKGDFTGANLTGVVGSFSSWIGADLSMASAQKSTFLHANFSGANIAGADFRFCDLRYADFSNTNKKGAFFFGCISNDPEIQERENFLLFGRKDELIRLLVNDKVQGMDAETAVVTLLEFGLTTDELVFIFEYPEDVVRKVAIDLYGN